MRQWILLPIILILLAGSSHAELVTYLQTDTPSTAIDHAGDMFAEVVKFTRLPDKRVNLVVLRDRNELCRTYNKKGLVCPIAFYTDKSQICTPAGCSGTIYVSIDTVTKGILAHEFTHALSRFRGELYPEFVAFKLGD